MNFPGFETLAGKRVLVVGGSSGIGLATAQSAAHHGALVTLVGRDAAALKAMNQDGENPRLPGIKLDQSIQVTDSLADGAKAEARDKVLTKALNAGR